MSVPPRRYPRKIKKQQARTSLEFSAGEWEKLKKAASLKGMRPSRFIHYALLETLERYPNADIPPVR